MACTSSQSCLPTSGPRSQTALSKILSSAGMTGTLTPQISWPVFEDKKYPYADGDEAPMVKEPRAVVALDADGDGRQDLAMVCHDRMLIYLARDKP